MLFKILSAIQFFVFFLSPFSICAFLTYAYYNSHRDMNGILVSCILLLVGIYVSYRLAKYGKDNLKYMNLDMRLMNMKEFNKENEDEE